MTDPVHDARRVRQATDRLLAAVGGLDATAVGRPSLLPGWSRGHVLAHLARNADALVNVLTGARTGAPTPMYASEDARDADIEQGAPRELSAHLEDLRTSAARLDEAIGALTPEQWRQTVALRGGTTVVAATLPFHRWTELELHHVDLGIGYGIGDLPAEFVDRQLDLIAGARFASRPDVPPLLLRAEDGRSWRTGRDDGEPVQVTGSAGALVGWLAGRTDGGGLSAAADALPDLPPLG